MGLFVRELLLDQFYFETIFPRIPEGISRTIKDSLSRLGCATVAVGCGGVGGTRRQGGGAADEGPSRRPPSVKAALSVSLSQRAPHVAGVRETGRGYANVDPSKHGGGGGGDGGGGSHFHTHRGGPPSRGPPHGAPPPGQPPWEREREYDHRRQEHHRGRSSRSRSRSRERRHRSRSRERHRSHHRSRSRDRHRDRDRHYRRSRSRSGDRGREPQEGRREERREQGPSDAGRSANDVFRALPPPLMTTTTALKDRY
jgi:pre-mRNA-splicing factor 38B